MVRQNQAHRLGPRGRVAHASSHRRGDGTGLRLLDATHGHAHVVAFGDHDHATRVDAFHQRVGHLLGIHKNLRLLFPQNRDLAYRWMSTRNKAFDNLTPVEVVKAWGFAGLLMVRAYLDRARGV